MPESFNERLLLSVADLPEFAGSAELVVVSGPVLLRPDAQTFEAMLEGRAPPDGRTPTPCRNNQGAGRTDRRTLARRPRLRGNA